MADSTPSPPDPLEPSQRFISIVLFAVVITRLPFLWFGYGSDPDAWRVANVADVLWRTGHYEVSRFPGYPLHEVATAPLVALGQTLDPEQRAIFSNGATLIATLILLLVWGQLVRRISQKPYLLIIGLAFAPLVWLDSAITMDYVWSLLFLVLSLNAAQQRKCISAGIWLGIAAGFRPSNIVGVVPILTLLALGHQPARSMIKFLFGCVPATLVAFLPMILSYGVKGWIDGTQLQMPALPFTDRALFFTYRSVYAIGPLAVVMVIGVVLLRRNEIVQQVREWRSAIVVSLVGLLVFSLLFFALPLDRSYLLPAFPFLLLLVEKNSSSRVFALFLICLILHAFVNIDIIQHQGVQGIPAPNVHTGIVVEELQRKADMMDWRSKIARLDVHGKIIVMTGVGAAFWMQNDAVEVDTSTSWRGFNDPVAYRRTEPDVHYIPLLTKDELDRVRNSGYVVYCLESAQPFVESTVGYTMGEAGIRLIKI